MMPKNRMIHDPRIPAVLLPRIDQNTMLLAYSNLDIFSEAFWIFPEIMFARRSRLLVWPPKKTSPIEPKGIFPDGDLTLSILGEIRPPHAVPQDDKTAYDAYNNNNKLIGRARRPSHNNEEVQ